MKARTSANLRGRGFALVTALALAALLPASAAQAASTSQTVSGTIGSELTLSVTTPPADMSITHTTPGSTSTVLAVVSTLGSWTLSIQDNGATTPGKLDRVDCITRSPTSGSLANALSWADPGASTSGTLSSSPATVKSGSGLISAETVNYTQSLGAAESVNAGDCYELSATYTVS